MLFTSEWLTAGQTRAFGTAMDIAMQIVDAGKLLLDVQRAEGLRDEMLSGLSTQLREEVNYIIELAKKPTSDVLDLFKTNLAGDFKYLAKELLAQGVQSAAGYKLSAMMVGQRAKIYGVMNIVDTEADVCFSIPEALMKLKAQRYYNKLIAPEDPSERDAFILSQNGKWSPDDFVVRLQEHDGLTAEDAKQVAIIRQNQIGVPDLRTAWFMVQKGFLKKSDWLSLAQTGQGYSKGMAEILFNYLFYDFSAMELFRISDLMPVPTAWIDTKLNALGLNPDDKLVMKNLLQARTLKDEINQTWGILADNYAWGLHTKEDLKKFLTDNGVPEIQANAKLVIADMLRDKVVLKLMRDAEIYLYRKYVQDEEQLFAMLQALDIDMAVANAITRNEASKKGIDWEMP